MRQVVCSRQTRTAMLTAANIDDLAFPTRPERFGAQSQREGSLLAAANIDGLASPTRPARFGVPPQSEQSLLAAANKRLMVTSLVDRVAGLSLLPLCSRRKGRER